MHPNLLPSCLALPHCGPVEQLYTISAFDAEGGDGDGTKAWAIFCGLISSVVSGLLAFLQVSERPVVACVCVCFFFLGGGGGGRLPFEECWVGGWAVQ